MNGFEAMLWFGYPAFVADGGAAAFEKGRTHVRFDGGWRGEKIGHATDTVARGRKCRKLSGGPLRRE